MENNKNKKSVKFQGDMLNFCDFIQVFVFTRNHHLKSAEHFELKILLFLARASASSDGKPCLIPVQRPYINAKAIPAGTRRQNDVVLTSMRRDDVASTSVRRHFGTICPLGYHDVASTSVQHFSEFLASWG